MTLIPNRVTDPQKLLNVLFSTGVLEPSDVVPLLGKDAENPTVPMVERALLKDHRVTAQRLRAIKQMAFGVRVFDPTTDVAARACNYPGGRFELPRENASGLGVLLLASEDQPTFALVENVVIDGSSSTQEDWLAQSTGGNYDLMLITASDFINAFAALYNDKRVVSESPTPSLHQLLTQAIDADASDVHLCVGDPPTMRVNGSMRRHDCEPVSAEWMQEAVLTIGGEEVLRLVHEEFEKDIAYAFGEVRFRVSIGLDREGINIVARRLPAHIPTMADINLPPAIRQFAELERGLVIVTGPTGSGKSTTLASLLSHIAKHSSRHLITLEDPIEYVLPGDGMGTVNQREVGSSVASFARGLRQALRQDPDVILVGELRDFETAKTALLAAETGHLVFATTHATTADGAIGRLLSEYPPQEQEAVRQQVAGSLRGVVGQMLIPKVSGKGRVASFEILVNTPYVAANLRKHDGMPTVRQLMETSSNEGMTTMDQSLARLVRQGSISESEAEFRARDVVAYRKFLSL